jgi:acyl carrier protein
VSDQEAAVTPAVVRRSDKDLSTDYVAPRTDLERLLASLWSERLGVAPVGVDDDYFELGGHSLAAAELLVDLAATTGVEVEAQVLFLQPTVGELAAAIEARGRGAEVDG